MKRFMISGVLLAFLVQAIHANALTDAVAAFTGTWTKLVWAGSGSGGGESFTLLDTKEGSERVLSTGGNFWYSRISRSGKWATWWNTSETRTYISDLTVANPPKKVLLDKANCTFWCARAFWVDPATGTEYVYCLNNYTGTAGFDGDGIYKVPLNSDGTADVSKAVQIYKAGNRVDESISVSQDGKKVGCAFPWPNTAILDVATGRVDYRHDGAAMFGCQANLAPDNSYRFHHCDDDHLGVYMFGPNMSTQDWYVDLLVNLAGNKPSGADLFAAPRWTNDVRYFTNTYPMEGPQTTVLEKWSADFKQPEKSMVIGSGRGGDAWLESGVTGGATEVRSVGRPLAVKVSLATLHAVDVMGRIVRPALMSGTNRTSEKSAGAGVRFAVSEDGVIRSALVR